ncbi:hypothetical protein [Christiangramia aquimixticola]|uniref:hypothetical protein n=1 Tax=Christiangramia aquimixticola TaxID=1697558 RepID=UPI003AA82EE2
MIKLRNLLLVFGAFLIVLPALISFSHVFTLHSHKLCDNYAEHHYHEKSVDCELHKFQKNSALTISLPEFDPVINETGKKLYFDFYDFLNDYEPLHFELRGPPEFA